MRRPHIPTLRACLLVVASAIAPTASARAGGPSVQSIAFQAPSIGRLMTYKIALPAGYDDPGGRRYPVLYLLHGLTSNYTAWQKLGAARAAEKLDLIVVMPDAGNSWYLNWAQTDDGKKDAWEDYIVKDLIGHVDSTFRTIAAREGRAINGLSMGGYGAITLGLRHPDLFCSIGSHSGALAFARSAADRLRSGQQPPQRKNAAAPSDKPNLDIATEGFRSPIERTPKGKVFLKPEDADAADPFKLVLSVPAEKRPHIYIDCGTEDRLIGAARKFARLLTEHTIPYTYAESPGGHNPPYWSREIGTSVAVQYAVIRRNLEAKQAEPPASRSEDKPGPADKKEAAKPATPAGS